jgi:anti-sigma B factor antagonist
VQHAVAQRRPPRRAGEPLCEEADAAGTHQAAEYDQREPSERGAAHHGHDSGHDKHNRDQPQHEAHQTAPFEGDAAVAVVQIFPTLRPQKPMTAREETRAAKEESRVADDDSAERADLVLTTTREGTSVLVAVAGELDAYSAPSLEELADDLRTNGCVRFTLDLSQTTFIDSSGLRSLILLHEKLVENGAGRLALQAPSDPVTRLLRITGLGEHFIVT